ncbi:nitrile hydratase beta subunit [Rhodococcus sp. AG1013]|uniref:SH3-like domain-containing protein n=1 Tax=Rhodococcus sp. AG1013 TaxID=2183996 RepID=UPI000E0B89CD|nr:SH3-like domain-containing protein [Rhodococcus sp. AG1013]RDI18488.1 nitrile hydratase beta subunit [Rhodococcus sp. AG1013]
MTTAQGYEIILGTLKEGSERGGALPDTDRKPDPWESAMQATVECLSWRGAWDNLERRHTEDELGETIYSEFPVHSRSAITTAHTLLDRGIVTQDELKAKMDRIRARLERA